MASKKSRKRAMAQRQNQTEAPKLAPITNPELVEALDTLKATRTPENEQKMFKAIEEAKFLTPVVFDANVTPDMKQGRVRLPDSTKMKFILVNTNDGRSFFPAFTDIDEANKLQTPGQENIAHIVRSIKDFTKMLKDPNGKVDGVVINPMNQNIILPKAYLVDVRGKQKETGETNAIPEGVKITYHEPSVYPTAVVNAVHDCCVNLEGVSRVWFKGMRAGAVSGHAFFVEMDTKNDTILEEIRKAAESQAKDVPVYVQPFTKEIETNVIKDDFPLFDKELDV